MRTATAGHGRRRQRFLGRAAALIALLVGGTLALAAPAQAFIFASPSPSFPDDVVVGHPFPAGVSIGNFSTPPESTANPVLTVSAIDLVPACSNGQVDCTGGTVDAGVFKSMTGTGTGSSDPPGNVTCTGTWTVTETPPGRFRFAPPGGEGTLLLATGEICSVSASMAALRVPSTDASPPMPGVQTFPVVAATISGPTVSGFRNSGNDVTTVIGAPVAPPSDFDGDGDSDPAVYRPSNGVWYSPASSVGWGISGDKPVPGDYDGDGRTDRAVYRPLSGVWYVNGSFLGATATAWGVSTDVPVPADYDGDNRTDLAVYRPSTGEWFVQRSSGGATGTAWGVPGDIPVPGDYDGDKKADLAVFRPSTGIWYVARSGGGVTSTGWGATGDIPVPGDYDGDGKTDQAVYRPPGVWYVSLSGGGATSIVWGAAGDIPVPGKYDADAKTDQAVFRPSSGIWFVQKTTGGATATAWGVNGDVPLPLPSAIGRQFFSPPYT